MKIRGIVQPKRRSTTSAMVFAHSGGQGPQGEDMYL